MQLYGGGDYFHAYAMFKVLGGGDYFHAYAMFKVLSERLPHMPQVQRQSTIFITRLVVGLFVRRSVSGRCGALPGVF